jgi:Uma2 family endonuclease
MSTITLAETLPPSTWTPAPLYRMTVDEYERIGEFLDDKRVELINGLLVKKMTQGDLHSAADELLGPALARAIPAGWHARGDKPVRLPPDSIPEPDRSVVRGTVRDYKDRTPAAADVALVVEVAQSSLSEDRAQGQLYARSGIPIYWIVNLLGRQVEVYSEPMTDGYQARVDYAAGQSVPVVLDGVKVGIIVVDDILP